MKLFLVAVLAGVAFSATGAAAPESSPCCGSDFDPQWSRDGSRIAFIRREPTGLSTLFTMAANGGDERPLLSLGADFRFWEMRPPLLSPDWANIALIDASSGLSGALKIERVDGAEVHEIGAHVMSFAWSPDSRHIAFHQTDRGGNTRIFVARSDGSDLRNLGPGEAPAWSPRGDRIAFVAPNGMVYVMNADGTERKLVYDGNGAVSYMPSWSPDGNRIAFFGASELIVVSTDGTRLFTTSADYGGAPPKWSPDGSLIGFDGGNVITVVRVGTLDRWSLPDHYDVNWSPLGNEFTASFSGVCRRSAIYRMSIPLTSRRLTLDCHIRGTDEPDVLNGTSFTDIITGLAGNDELLGGDGADRLIGGPGDDTLLGGPMGDRIEGGYGADLLLGGNESSDNGDPPDVDDWLFGGPGPDDLRGGPARDILTGDAGNDVLRGGPGTDTLYGGPGNDRIFSWGDTRDRFGRTVRDIVRCGNGRHDVALVDRQDHVTGCETVHRR